MPRSLSIGMTRLKKRQLEDWLLENWEELMTAKYNLPSLAIHINKTTLLGPNVVVSPGCLEGCLKAIDRKLPPSNRGASNLASRQSVLATEVKELTDRVTELEDLYLKLAKVVEENRPKKTGDGVYRG